MSPKSPSADNYQLGKGVLFFNQKKSGVFLGELDLGNAPDFSFNVSLEKLEHFSSRSGLKAKDKTVVNQITPGCSFTLDEVNSENLSLLTLGVASTVAAGAGAVAAEEIVSRLDRRVTVSKRGIGATKLTHGTVTGSGFVVGETITGGTSGATGKCSYVGSGYILVVGSNVSGVYGGSADWDEATETITGTTSSSTASLTVVGAFIAGGSILVTDDGASTVYVAGTDYELSTTLKDATIGRIHFLSGGTVTDGETVEVSFDYSYAAYTKISSFTQTEIEGTLRFVSDNPVGNNEELVAWRVNLSPEGDTAMIGEDWSTMSFTGEILKVEGTGWDGVDHSASPYLDIILP